MKRHYIALVAIMILLLPTFALAQRNLPEIPKFDSVNAMFDWVAKTKAERDAAGQSGMGLTFMQLRPQLAKLGDISPKDNYKAGLLFYYAQMREEAMAALEQYIADYPQEVNPEIVSILMECYYYTNQFVKVEAFYKYFLDKWPDHKDTKTFGIMRRIDEADNFAFISYVKQGLYEEALAQMHRMVERRDRDKPEHYNISSTIFNLGSTAYVALGRYDDGIEFLKQERAKFAPEEVIGQYADFHRVMTEYEKIAAIGDLDAALAHLEAQRDLFPNKYALRKYETALAHARLRGKPMPELTVTDYIQRVDGYDLDNLRGKVVVLDFWATWCHACIEKMPHMNHLMSEYADDGLLIIGITKAQGKISGMENLGGIPLEYDKELELTKKLVAEYPRYEMHYPVVMDREGESFPKYGVNFLPTIVVIDQEGIVRWAGFPVGKELDTLLEELLES
jgi:thiol-disulfide isomerase/thioredoxin